MAHEVDESLKRLLAKGQIQRVGGTEDDPIYDLTDKARAREHDRRVSRLENAALDWAEARGVEIEIEEEKRYLLITIDAGEYGEEEVSWYWDFDDAGLWQMLDEKLEELRPAGTRCLPGGLDLNDLDDALAEFNTAGPLSVDLYRRDSHAFRVEVHDEVTNENESLLLTWEPGTTKAEFLDALTRPILERLSAIEKQELTDAEFALLEALPPHLAEIAAKSPFVTNRLREPIALSQLIKRAKEGGVSSHWKLRNLLEELLPLSSLLRPLPPTQTN